MRGAPRGSRLPGDATGIFVRRSADGAWGAARARGGAAAVRVQAPASVLGG